MLISVADYAKKRNISTARVYQLLKKKLKDKATQIDGKWYIEVDNTFKTSIEGLDKTTKRENEEISANDEIKPSETIEKPFITGFKEDSKDIEKELEAAKAEIVALKEELKAEKEHNRQIETRMVEMMEKLLQLTENTQILTKNIIDTQKTPALPDVREEPKKKGFFKWLKNL